MSNVLKSIDCLCTACVTDPCDGGCGCDFSETGGDAGYTGNVYINTAPFYSRDVYVYFEAYTLQDRLQIYFNSALYYDTGCMAGNVSHTVNTTGPGLLEVVVTGACAGGSGTVWDFTISCEVL